MDQQQRNDASCGNPFLAALVVATAVFVNVYAEGRQEQRPMPQMTSSCSFRRTGGGTFAELCPAICSEGDNWNVLGSVGEIVHSRSQKRFGNATSVATARKNHVDTDGMASGATPVCAFAESDASHARSKTQMQGFARTDGSMRVDALQQWHKKRLEMHQVRKSHHRCGSCDDEVEVFVYRVDDARGQRQSSDHGVV